MIKTGLALSLLLSMAAVSATNDSGSKLEDPTRPLVNTKTKLSEQPKEATQSKPVAKPKNILMGILETSQGKLAIIDGQRLKVGNNINGYRVRRINDNSVVLTQSGKTKTLELAPSVKRQGN